MGATIENAIVSASVILIICALIILPLELCGSAYDGFMSVRDEVEYHDQDEEIIRSIQVGEYNCVDTSPERFCTFLSGISENYRLIYDTVAGG